MLKIDETELHYTDRGSGEPLLLLHGLTGTGADWRHVFDLDSLAQTYRVIAPDARGHGRSTNPTGVFTFERCARDVLALMDHLGIERARAVGMSLGGKTLLHVATRAPDRLDALVLVSAAPRLPEDTRARFRAAATAPHTDDEWAMMRAQHPYGDAQIAALWALPATLANDETALCFEPEQLRMIGSRTLVVAGDRDPLYPIELAVELFHAIPNASLYVVPNGGHCPVFGAEREPFAKRALELLAMPRPAAGPTTT